MPHPSVKQLEAFWWAATCANFATAAERVHLSVSSLSKRISELESTLGQSLFDRSGHRAVLTEAWATSLRSRGCPPLWRQCGERTHAWLWNLAWMWAGCWSAAWTAANWTLP